ncbi:Putative aldehyde dehydrogenase SA1924 [Raoultella planticola]|uniref:Aldehyde dehydrogenase SA1924 n=1 Tax=Raoultella planticola TaxID=575 RepID=A0A485C1G2_RAOPL|nr:Putative aldehyde dehydrogenase SA1924 [Raoultella planticola]
MLHIDKIYINGEFVTPHGSETFALFNPATEEMIGQARLADEEDARRAIAAAKAAFPCWSRTTKQQRLDVLERMYQAVRAREADLLEAIVTEYGARLRARNGWRHGRRKPLSRRWRRWRASNLLNRRGVRRW